MPKLRAAGSTTFQYEKTSEGKFRLLIWERAEDGFDTLLDAAEAPEKKPLVERRSELFAQATEGKPRLNPIDAH